MKKILIILIVFISTQSFGQTWIDNGAVWHYDFSVAGAWGGFYRIEYNMDTLIDGQNCQKLDLNVYTFWPQYDGSFVADSSSGIYGYTYSSGDTVFYYRNGEFMVLYDFGAYIGDRWLISVDNGEGGCDDSSYVEVIDTGSIDINGIKSRTITLQHDPKSGYGINGVIIERFGISFPDYAPCDSDSSHVDGAIYQFKCFQDNSFPLYNPSGKDCQYMLTYLGIEDNELDQVSITTYYNTITIKAKGTATIYNLQGQRVHQSKLTGNNIISLDKGIYLVKVRSEGRSVTKKVYLSEN
ncbi:MAG: T9SS type A sorting domain-containing protein [Bacteroidetes bacterium]|nr:T9SS type A sorting domain-containing protein [Bacteroidota bacterium]